MMIGNIVKKTYTALYGWYKRNSKEISQIVSTALGSAIGWTIGILLFW